MTTSRRNRETNKFLESLIGGPLTLALFIKSIREGEEWSQTTMAEKLGTTRAHICDVEKGRKRVSAERAARWAKILGYSEK